MLGVIAQDLFLAFGKDKCWKFPSPWACFGLRNFCKLMFCVLHSALKWQYYVGKKIWVRKKNGWIRNQVDQDQIDWTHQIRLDTLQIGSIRQVRQIRQIRQVVQLVQIGQIGQIQIRQIRYRLGRLDRIRYIRSVRQVGQIR